MYKYWIEPESGDFYYNTGKSPVESFEINGNKFAFITTPKVKEVAKKYYGNILYRYINIFIII